MLILQVTLKELTGPNVEVLTVNATDRDSGENARIAYSMITVDGFKINSETGIHTTFLVYVSVPFTFTLCILI